MFCFIQFRPIYYVKKKKAISQWQCWLFLTTYKWFPRYITKNLSLTYISINYSSCWLIILWILSNQSIWQKNVFKIYIQISSNIFILQKLIMLNKYLRQYVNLVIVNNKWDNRNDTYNTNSISFKATVWMIQWQVFFSKVVVHVVTLILQYSHFIFQYMQTVSFSCWQYSCASAAGGQIYSSGSVRFS